jgi:hypothetical protein
VPMEMDWMNIVASIAHANAVTSALLQVK